MRTLLTGGSGLVGSALIEYLHSAGHDIRCLKRNKDTSEGIWKTTHLFSDEQSSDPFDTIIHLAGENVVEGRWSAAKKQRILESRTEGTRQLVDYLSTLEKPPQTLLSASAIGFYGNRHDEILTETSGFGGGFLAEVCKQWEAAARKAESFGVRVVILRLGMVLSPGGGALHKMLLPFKAGLGGPIGKGNQYMSWISIRDILGIVDFLINTATISGPVNIVAPTPVTNREFTRTLAEVLKRPARLPAPPFALKLILGKMADEMLLTSSRSVPEKLTRDGYVFKDTDLKSTLEFCIDPSKCSG